MSDRYSIHVFADDGEPGYIAICPEFPGVSASAKSRELALAEVQVVLELAIDTYQAEGWTLPTPLALPHS